MGPTASMGPQLLEDMGAVVTPILYTETTCSVSHSCQVVRPDVRAASALVATEAREAPRPPHKAPSLEGSCRAFPGPCFTTRWGDPCPQRSGWQGLVGVGGAEGAGRDPRSPGPHILHVKILEAWTHEIRKREKLILNQN